MQIFNKRQRGFTLIELLVVIAIIGILASIVLVSMSGATKKAKDARITADLAQVRTIATLIEADENAYTQTCKDATTLGTTAENAEHGDELTVIQNDITTQGGSVTCYASADSFCISAKLIAKATGEYYCIDDEGHAGTYSSNACTNATSTCE